MSERMIPITVPKWGLTMDEGKLTAWLVKVGSDVSPGDELVEIETSKIANVVEAQGVGVLRRIVVAAGATLPVGALLGIVAAADVDDAEIDAFVAAYQDTFVPEEISAGSGTAEPQFADVGAFKISYSRLGPTESEATPIVFIHGFGGDGNNWLFNVAALSFDRPAFVFDLPGHGRSSKSVDDGRVETLAAATRGFLEIKGIKRAHLVGHSLGAAIALEITKEDQSRVASLTLIAPAGLAATINKDFLKGFAEANSRREMKPVMEHLFADKSLVTRDLIDEILRSTRIDGARDALRQIATACFPNGQQANRYHEFLSDTALPVLIILGQDDEIMPAPEGISAHIISDAGHMPQMENANQVNALIKEHIESAGV